MGVTTVPLSSATCSAGDLTWDLRLFSPVAYHWASYLPRLQISLLQQNFQAFSKGSILVLFFTCLRKNAHSTGLSCLLFYLSLLSYSGGNPTHDLTHSQHALYFWTTSPAPYSIFIPNSYSVFSSGCEIHSASKAQRCAAYQRRQIRIPTFF